MNAALTHYWQDFINQMIKSGRYNRPFRSDSGGASLLARVGRLAKEVRGFLEEVFAGGRAGEPDGKTIGRIVARQKSQRKARR